MASDQRVRVGITTCQAQTLRFRRQTLEQDEHGHAVWRVHETTRELDPARTALVLCDVWDKHWCRGANERLAKLLPRMNEAVSAARDKGMLIVHAPSDTMEFYKDSPARRRALDAPKADPPENLPHDDPPQPIDASDGGSDTPPDKQHGAWSRQHPAIEIDEARDLISDDGADLYGFYQERGISDILIMGVHTNMCVLGRSFAIKQMVRWGFNVALIRDLTDTMYNPGMAPYVSHDDGTRLAVEYIEKFWCPTISSENLLR